MALPKSKELLKSMKMPSNPKKDDMLEFEELELESPEESPEAQELDMESEESEELPELAQFEDEDLQEELEKRGFTVKKSESEAEPELEELDMESEESEDEEFEPGQLSIKSAKSAP